ncbi:hypothetical protein AB0L75_14640 [Streptomyces sp. NPDC052101]|uniref:hypothetical protein n=1 Tax=Streptomyces sp. NPDC052101 TaxID=3155763 RepID=UPI00341BF8D6
MELDSRLIEPADTHTVSIRVGGRSKGAERRHVLAGGLSRFTAESGVWRNSLSPTLVGLSGSLPRVKDDRVVKPQLDEVQGCWIVPALVIPLPRSARGLSETAQRLAYLAARGARPCDPLPFRAAHRG